MRVRFTPRADWDEEIDRPAAAAHISTLDMTPTERKKARERLRERGTFGFGRVLDER